MKDEVNNKGVHASFRVLQSFLYCYEMENEFTDWFNLIEKMKVKEPRQAIPITMGFFVNKRESCI